jgi:hypothetical protein
MKENYSIGAISLIIFGGCLCGNITYQIDNEQSIFPHLCSCHMCQKWSGAPTVAWVEFPLKSFKWTGKGGEPAYYQSSEKTSRGFCPKCGSTLCAVDDGYDNIALTIASLDNPNLVVPDKQHSYHGSAPSWWKVKVES